jgi:hypothetical protein
MPASGLPDLVREPGAHLADRSEPVLLLQALEADDVLHDHGHAIDGALDAPDSLRRSRDGAPPPTRG